MNKNMCVLDLRKCEDCRTFLNDLKVDGKAVSEFELADGTTKQIANLSDEEAIRFANELYQDFFGGKDGDIVDTNIWTGSN